MSDSFARSVASSGKGLGDVKPKSLWGPTIVPITAEGPSRGAQSELLEVDCCYERCPHAPNCTIAKSIRELTDE